MKTYESLMRRLAAAVLESPGDCPPALRRAVAARAGAVGGRSAEALPPLDPPLGPHVDRIALSANKVTPNDVAALRAAGYSENAIFEITVAAALGAGQARLERGLAALRRHTSCT